MAAAKKFTQEELDKATEQLYNNFELPDGYQVKEVYPCTLKGYVGIDSTAGKLYLTKTFVAFVGKRTFGANITRIWSVEDTLDLEAVRKNAVRIVGTNSKVHILTNFEDGADGRDRAFKSIKRLFFGISGNTVLHTAVESLEFDKVRQILERDVTQLSAINRQEQTALGIACIKNDINMVNLILEFYDRNRDKVDINQVSTKGDHILHWVCKISAIEDQILLNLLKFNGISVDPKNFDQTTPLHYFASYNHSLTCARVGKEFIERGADPNAATSQGETPLHKAMFNNKVRVFMVKMLLEHKAIVDVRGGQRGDTPLHYAIRLSRRDLVECLLSSGSDYRIQNNDGKDCLTVAIEEDALADHSTKTSQIVDILGNVKLLVDMLEKCDLLELTKQFITEGLHDPAVLAQVDDTALTSLGFDLKLGSKMKLLKEIENLRSEIEKAKTEENRLRELKESQRKKQEAETALQGKLAHNLDSDELRNELDLGDGRWEISNDDLEYTAKLGQGASGQVFKGLFRGTQEVAIKVLTATDIEAELADFKKEFMILTALNSPYTIKFYGASIEPKLCMVMELCERGSLYDLLNKEAATLDWGLVIHFLRDMAEGVAVLHEHKPAAIIHRDLKSLNLLVTKDYKVKLCDFGLSRAKQGDMQTFNRLCGTFAYCAPEVFNGEKSTEKSDVFSMGIVIWEVMKTILQYPLHLRKYEMPYAEYGLTYDFQIIVQTAQGLRPSIPDGAPMDIVKVFQACVDAVPTKRPDATQIATMFKTCEADYKRDPKAFLANVYKAPKKDDAAAPQVAPAASATAAKFSGWGKKDEVAAAPSEPRKSGFNGWGKKDEPAAPAAPVVAEKPAEKSAEPSQQSDKFPGWANLEHSDDESTTSDKKRRASLDKSGDKNGGEGTSSGGIKRAGASKGVTKSQTAHRK